MAVDPTIIEQAIEDAASAPKDVTSGTKRVVQHSIKDLIAARDEAGESVVPTRRTLPIRFAKVRPGGSV